MCARTTLTKPSLAEIAGEIEAEFSAEDVPLYRPRWNVAPSDTSWIVIHRGDARVLSPAKWGYLANGKPLINVRGEQVAAGSGFREAFASRRCVLVADGFYEWNAKREPTWFRRVDGSLLLLGALFQPPQTLFLDSRSSRQSRTQPSPRFMTGCRSCSILAPSTRGCLRRPAMLHSSLSLPLATSSRRAS